MSRDESRTASISGSSVLVAMPFRKVIENSRYSSHACETLRLERNNAAKMREENIFSTQSIKLSDNILTFKTLVRYKYMLNNERSNLDTSRTDTIVRHGQNGTKMEVKCYCV